MKDNPCRYCVPPKREPGCQDRCPDREEWLKELYEKKELIRKAKDDELAIRDFKRLVFNKKRRR